MKNIYLPDKLQVGLWDVKVENLSHECIAGNHGGFARLLHGDRAIELPEGEDPRWCNYVFLHEILHQIDRVFLGDKLEEDSTTAISLGLAQVMEQLGVRFLLKKDKDAKES